MKRMIGIVGALWLCLLAARADESRWSSFFANMGFEDVKVKVDDGVLYVAMQNRAFRGTFYGWADVIRRLNGSTEAPDSVVIVALEEKVPRVCIRARLHDAGATKVTADYAVTEVMNRLNGVKRTNSSFGKVDVVPYPEVSLDNHRFDILFEAVTSIAPTAEVSLWKGAKAVAQVVVPVWNNISGEVDYVRPGYVTLSQSVRPANRWLATLTAGLFSNDRAGVNGHLEYYFNSNLTLGANVGVTGFSDFNNGSWHKGVWSDVDASLTASYYEPRTGLQGELGAYRYVYGYYGVRGDLTRHYGDYTVGVYAILVQGGHNAGFHFSLPIQGKNPYKRKKVRVKLPDYFDWEYNMVSNHKTWTEDHLKSYEMVPDKNRSAHYWQAEYLERNINAMHPLE